MHNSFDDIPLEVPWYRSFFPYQGSLRKELLTAINLVNYNQDNSQANALVGLGSFAATAGGLFSIVGGNYQIIQSAIYQATTASMKHCDGEVHVEKLPQRITRVVGGPAAKLTVDAVQCTANRKSWETLILSYWQPHYSTPESNFPYNLTWTKRSCSQCHWPG